MRFAVLSTLLALAPSAAFAENKTLSELLGWLGGAAPAVSPAPAAKAAPAAFPKKPETVIEGIPVRGDADFTEKTRAALALLKKTKEFGDIKGAITAIEQFACSGINYESPDPIFRVGAPSWKAETIWYASDIAHDSYHVQVYRRAMKGESAMLTVLQDAAEEERVAMQYQGRVLAELHADKRYLAYLRDLEKNPRYQLTGPRPIRPGTKTRPPINEAELEAAACGTRSW